MCVALHLILLIFFHAVYNFASDHFKRTQLSYTRTQYKCMHTFSLSSNRFLSWLNNCPVYYRRKWKQHPDGVTKHTHTPLPLKCSDPSKCQNHRNLQGKSCCLLVASLPLLNREKEQEQHRRNLCFRSIPKGFKNSHNIQMLPFIGRHNCTLFMCFHRLKSKRFALEFSLWSAYRWQCSQSIHVCKM